MILRALPVIGGLLLILNIQLVRLATGLPCLGLHSRPACPFRTLPLLEHRLQVFHFVPPLLLDYGRDDCVVDLIAAAVEEIVDQGSALYVDLLDILLRAAFAHVRVLAALSLIEILTHFYRRIALVCRILVLDHVEFQELVLATGVTTVLRYVR